MTTFEVTEPKQEEQPVKDEAEKPEGKRDGKGGKGSDDPESRFRAELTARDRRIAELEASERHWSEVARRTPAEEAKPEPEEDVIGELLGKDDPADDSPAGLIDELSTDGIKALVKRGVVSERKMREILKAYHAKSREQILKDVRKEVQAERAKVEKQAERRSVLLQDFPELNNPKSELFELTSTKLKKLQKLDPDAQITERDMYMAADAAQSELNGRGPRKPKEEDRRYERYGAEEDQDREDRIRAQMGDRGRRRAADTEEPELRDDQAEVLKIMKVTPENFRKQQKSLGIRRGA